MDKRYAFGGLIVAVGVGVGAAVQEVCERDGSSASACPIARVDLNHDDRRGPEGPPMTTQPAPMGPTGNATAMPPRQFFVEPQTPEYRPSIAFEMPHGLTALEMTALQRRYPVVIEGTWRSVFDDEPAPESTVAMNQGRFTPAAHFLGPLQCVGISTSTATAALTLIDAQGNVVAS